MIDTRNFRTVEDQPDLKRDPVTGAIINDNQAAYAAALERRRLNNSVISRIDQIEKDLEDIKSMFSLIIERLDRKS